MVSPWYHHGITMVSAWYQHGVISHIDKPGLKAGEKTFPPAYHPLSTRLPPAQHPLTTRSAPARHPLRTRSALVWQGYHQGTIRAPGPYLHR